MKGENIFYWTYRTKIRIRTFNIHKEFTTVPQNEFNWERIHIKCCHINLYKYQKFKYLFKKNNNYIL